MEGPAGASRLDDRFLDEYTAQDGGYAGHQAALDWSTASVDGCSGLVDRCGGEQQEFAEAFDYADDHSNSSGGDGGGGGAGGGYSSDTDSSSATNERFETTSTESSAVVSSAPRDYYDPHWEPWNPVDADAEEESSSSTSSYNPAIVSSFVGRGLDASRSTPPGGSIQNPTDAVWSQFVQELASLGAAPQQMQYASPSALTLPASALPTSADGLLHDASTNPFWNDTSMNPIWNGTLLQPGVNQHSAVQRPHLQQNSGEQPQKRSLCGSSQTQLEIGRLIDLFRVHKPTLKTKTEVWGLVESLILSEDAEAFEQRPPKVPDSTCRVFREPARMRRKSKDGADRWQNSGGKKGSTVWPPGDNPRIRCQYGKLHRVNAPPLRFYEYTYIINEFVPGSREEAVAARRLFVVSHSCRNTNDGSVGGDQYASGPTSAPFRGKGAPELPGVPHSLTPRAPSALVARSLQVNTAIDAQLARLQANVSALEEPANLEAMCDLLSLISEQKSTRSCYRRPRVLGDPLSQRLFIEVGKSRRDMTLPNDRWANSGGKRAVVELTTTTGRRLQRRAGRVIQQSATHENSPPDYRRAANVASKDLRYLQYNIATAGRSDVKLYYVFYKAEMPTEPPSKLSGMVSKRRFPKGRAPDHATDRPKRARRVSDKAVAGVGSLAFAGLACLLLADRLQSSENNGGSSAPPDSDASTCIETVRWKSVASVVDGTGVITAHPPQHATTWWSDDAVYAFGGSSSTWTDQLLAKRATHPAIMCYAPTVGITDELWKFDRKDGGDSTWTLVSGGAESRAGTRSSRVQPRARAAAASWTVNGGPNSMVFGGMFELCVDFSRGVILPDMYIFSGCARSTHCGTFVRTNSTCYGAAVYQSDTGDRLYRVDENNQFTRWLIGPSHECKYEGSYLQMSSYGLGTIDDAWGMPLGYANWWEEQDSGEFSLVPNSFMIKPVAHSTNSAVHTTEDFPVDAVDPALHYLSTVFLPPTALYFFNASSSNWTLMGGTDKWTQILAYEATSIIDDGFVHTGQYVASDERTSRWPLPRSRTHTFTIYGQATAGTYMFSGRFQMIQSKLQEPQTEDLLLNDLWFFSEISVTMSLSDRDGFGELAQRVARCGTSLDRPDILPEGKPYPGARQDAATWSTNAAAAHASAGTHVGRGWMFGGIGHKLPIIPVDQDQSSQGFELCSSVPLFAADVQVGSLCDLWSFQPARGWQLEYSCTRDRTTLQTVANVADYGGDGPSASIYSTAWVQVQDRWMHTEETLWMFGGVTECPTATTRYRTAERSFRLAQSDLSDRYDNVCDSALMSSDQSAADQLGCSSDLWGFSLGSGRWTRTEIIKEVDGTQSVLDGRCGAHYIGHAQGYTDTSSDDTNRAFWIDGGWGGLANGVCAVPAITPPSFKILQDHSPSDGSNSPADQAPWAVYGLAKCFEATEGLRGNLGQPC